MPCLKAPSSSEIPTGFGWGRGDREELGCESSFDVVTGEGCKSPFATRHGHAVRPRGSVPRSCKGTSLQARGRSTVAGYRALPVPFDLKMCDLGEQLLFPCRSAHE